jgi:hypothetical protein
MWHWNICFRKLGKGNISMRTKGLHLSEAFMKKRYVMERKSPDDIAKECGVSVQLIYRQLKKFGLKR